MPGDIRYALRQLKKSPAFTAAAVATLALGIGANTAIFTVVESVLLAPLPYHDANRIVILDTHWTDSGHTSPRVTGPDGADIRGQAHDLEAVSLYSGGEMGVQLADHAVFTVVTGVDADFARVFGLRPAAGHLFTNAGAHREAMVSLEFARENFGSAAAALGKTIGVESEPLQITGVLPAGFEFPSHTQVWEALPEEPESVSRTAFNYRAVAKLRPGVSVAAARAELGAISHRLSAAYPVDNRDKQLSVVPLQDAVTGSARPTLLLLWAAVGAILLIACVNVAHLELARALERQRELAVRAALGSSSRQLSRMVITESLLVALTGGALGALLAGPAVHAFVAMAPQLPGAGQIHLNGWVLAFTAMLSLLATVAASLAPARRAGEIDPAEALKQDSSRGMSGRSTTVLRDGLVIAEVAATFVLAVGAGLLLHSMAALMTRKLGFETQRMLVVDADAPAHTTAEALSVVRQYSTIFARLANLPGVQQVAGVMGLPTGEQGSNGYYSVKGGVSMTAPHAPSADFSVASPNYFRTMGIPLLQGRDFSAGDQYTSPFVAVVSEALARQSFGNSDPIGRQIQCGLDSDKWMTVIGVVGDVRQDSPAERPGPTLYMPMEQHPFYGTEIHMVLRTAVAPLSLMHAVRQTVAGVNPQIATRFTTMDAMVGQSMASERFRTALVTCFAALALLLAMLGVYGTMAYSVSQRRFEIGLRMAFGADRSAVLGMILRHAAVLALWGIGLGVVGSLVADRLMVNLLTGVGPMDPVSLITAAGLILLTAGMAALVPARRAASFDPMKAFRAQ